MLHMCLYIYIFVCVVVFVYIIYQISTSLFDGLTIFLMDLGTTVSAGHGEDHGVADEPLKTTVTLYQSLFIQNSI